MLTLYKFHFDARHGNLYGLFIADDQKVQKLIEDGDEVYFGEVCGKHSDVYGPIESIDITKVSSDPEVLAMVERNGLVFGYNPFDYINGENE